MLSKKAKKIDEIFTVDLTVSVKLTVKISSIFVAFLENTNFKPKQIGLFWEKLSWLTEFLSNEGNSMLNESKDVHLGQLF